VDPELDRGIRIYLSTVSDDNGFAGLFLNVQLCGTSPIQFKKSSVADPGSLSRISEPDFYPSQISDPGSNNSTKRGGGAEILFVLPFL
jgi:hypothetical protein